MSLEAINAWQNDPTGDDTSSMANERTLAVVIDNDGVGEAPTPECYTAFVATAAAFLHALGRTGDHLLDHASSTNRKVDLIGTTLELDPSCWFPDIGILVDRLSTPSSPRRHSRMWQYLVDDSEQLWLADGMAVRWLVSEWDDANTRAELERLGEPTTPLAVSRESINRGEFGPTTGRLPPW
jgi:hypothetical protein